MRLKTPRFWYPQPQEKASSLWPVALAPLGWLYGWIARQRFDLYYPVPLSRPVICVGNLVAGGAGKTPVVMSLARILKERGHNPHLLTRGYGGLEEGPIQVAPNRDTAEDVGDEALLLVHEAPTWVSRNRPLGAQAGIDSGASLVVMDDGLQNPAMYRDYSIVVIDGGAGFGNGRVMPAGPLREYVSDGLARADCVVILGEDVSGAEKKIRSLAPDMPVFAAQLAPSSQNIDLKGRKIFAFAGIGRPQKFKATLEKAGALIEGWGEYPDHYLYKSEDLQPLIDAAIKADCPVVTTAKDHVRLPQAFKDKVQVYSVDVAWQDAKTLVDHIEKIISQRRR